jgi:hypothetical protein
LATSPLRLTTSNFIFQMNTCGYNHYVASSLTRGWVCRLQLLVVSPAQSLSGPSPQGLMTTFYSLTLETPQPRRPGPRPPGTGWPSYTPRHWVCDSRIPVFCLYTVIWRLKVGIEEPEKTSTARQRLGKQVALATDTQVTIEAFLYFLFGQCKVVIKEGA